jgi:hypothetical protein
VNLVENGENPNKFGKSWEKRCNCGTKIGFSIDKRETKPHRKRRWVRFTRINTGLFNDQDPGNSGHRNQVVRKAWILRGAETASPWAHEITGERRKP